MKQVLKYTGYILLLFIIGYFIWRFSYILVWVLIAAMVSFVGQPLVTLFDKIHIRKLRMPRLASALLALLVGYGLANSANWNRPLLLALGMPGFPLLVSAVVGLVKTGLTVLVTPSGGYVAESAILSAYLVVSVGIILWRGLGELNRRGQALEAAEAAK